MPKTVQVRLTNNYVTFLRLCAHANPYSWTGDAATWKLLVHLTQCMCQLNIFTITWTCPTQSMSRGTADPSPIALPDRSDDGLRFWCHIISDCLSYIQQQIEIHVLQKTFRQPYICYNYNLSRLYTCTCIPEWYAWPCQCRLAFCISVSAKWCWARRCTTSRTKADTVKPHTHSRTPTAKICSCGLYRKLFFKCIYLYIKVNTMLAGCDCMCDCPDSQQCHHQHAVLYIGGVLLPLSAASSHIV